MTTGEFYTLPLVANWKLSGWNFKGDGALVIGVAACDGIGFLRSNPIQYKAYLMVYMNHRACR